MFFCLFLRPPSVFFLPFINASSIRSIHGRTDPSLRGSRKSRSEDLLAEDREAWVDGSMGRWVKAFGKKMEEVVGEVVLIDDILEYDRIGSGIFFTYLFEIVLYVL